MKPRIKICCISSLDEAMAAVEAGASAVGLVGKMPSGPGPISDELIKEIAAGIPPPVATFLLTSETRAGNIISHYKRTLTNTIQIVDAVPEGTYGSLKSAIPGIRIVQVIHVMDERAVDEALRISGMVDALLLDSGNPGLKVKELGGTGRTHDWKLSRRICEASTCPVFLAGGLNPENVRRAVEEVSPFGVDVCNGVRTGSKLDREKLEKFVHEATR